MIHIDINEKKYDKVIFSKTSIDIKYGSFIGIKVLVKVLYLV